MHRQMSLCLLVSLLFLSALPCNSMNCINNNASKTVNAPMFMERGSDGEGVSSDPAQMPPQFLAVLMQRGRLVMHPSGHRIHECTPVCVPLQAA